MTTQMSRHFLKVVLVVTFISGIADIAFAEAVKIGTGAAATENIFNKIKNPMEKANGVNLIILANGPVQALKDLDAGSIDAAVGGVTFLDWMAMMDKEGYAIPDKTVYKNQVIGKDFIKVLTNKDVTLASLSKEQLAAIFTGRTKNWAEVGGPDTAVVVLVGGITTGT